jgi:hypothetical protein
MYNIYIYMEYKDFWLIKDALLQKGILQQQMRHVKLNT